MNLRSERHPSLTSATAASAASVSGLLLESLQAMAQVGEAENACRFAGRAYVLLRTSHPDIARRFDVFLHRVTPGLSWSEPPRQADWIDSRDPADADKRVASASGNAEPKR